MQKTIVFTFALSLVCAAASAQSLGDIAKQNAAKKDAAAADGKTKPVAKTYTDEDLKTVTPMPSATDGSTELPPVSTTTRDLIRGESYWRARLQPLLDKYAADRQEGDAVFANLQRVQAQLISMPSNPRLALMLFGAENTRLANELNMWTARLKADREDIDALKEEARRAGALPGWLR